ncbi:hypothetical protein Tco_0634663 [Tanacetum coccineum]
MFQSLILRWTQKRMTMRDPEEDPVDYPVDGGDDGDDEDGSSEDDEDNDMDIEVDDDEEEEEHLTPADFVVVANQLLFQAHLRKKKSRSRLLSLRPPTTTPCICVPAWISIQLQSYTSMVDAEILLHHYPDSISITTKYHNTYPVSSPGLCYLLYACSLFVYWVMSCYDRLESWTHLVIFTTITNTLHLLSTDRREDRPKVNLPPQKRLGVTLSPAYEVGESTSAVVARPARGLTADYGFVATIDREIRRYPERDVGYGITDSWDEIVETLYGAPVSTNTELGYHITAFKTRVRQDTDEIYTRRQRQLTEALKLVKSLQTHMAELQRQQGPAKGPA